MKKDVLFNTERVIAGVNKVADAIKVTLGPSGRRVMIKPDSPEFTLDGVTVARQISLEEGSPENMGAKAIKAVAEKANEASGDGTSTATILCQALVNEAMVGVKAGFDPIRIKTGMEAGLKIVLENLLLHKKNLDSKEEIKQIAKVSSRDQATGEVLAELFNEIGKDGSVVTEDVVKVSGIWSETVPGYRLDTGFLSPYFITKAERQEAIVEKPYVWVVGKEIGINADLLRVLELVAVSESRALVVVADDVTGEALATLIGNKMRNIIKCIAVRVPKYGEEKKDTSQDIAAFVGAKYMSEELGDDITTVMLDELGQCDRVVATKDSTIFIKGNGKQEAIDERIAIINKKLEDPEKSEYESKLLRDRRARLTGSVGIVKIGAISESELKEKKYLVEDAIYAVKSALAEGIVIGGGLELWKMAEGMRDSLHFINDAERFGFNCLLKAMQAPAETILRNSGFSPDKILRFDEKNQGFNAATGEYGDMFKMGIIDPAKVVRVGIEQSVKQAGLLINTAAVVYEPPEDKDEK